MISSAALAVLANDVYNDLPSKGTYVWNRYDHRVGPNGLFCAAYVTPKSRMLVIAIRGTDDKKDLVVDKNLALGTSPFSQFNSALAFYDAWVSHLGGWLSKDVPIHVCGHSLGGAVAAMIGMARANCHVVTFNRPNTKLDENSMEFERIKGGKKLALVNFRMKGDVVSGCMPPGFGPVIEIAGENKLARYFRGALAGADLVDHGMGRLKDAIILHENSELSPMAWAEKIGYR